MNAIFTRVSVRRFTEKAVEPEKLEKVVRAAFAAPSAMNQQPWEFFVVTDRKKIDALGDASPYAGPVKNAPAAIVVAYRRKGLSVPEYADIDCAIATENILLEIEAQGLGGVMIGIAPHEERMAAAAKAIDMPEDLAAFTIVALGYPETKPPRQERYDASRVRWIK